MDKTQLKKLFNTFGRSSKDAGRMSERLLTQLGALLTPDGKLVDNARHEFNMIWCEHLAELEEKQEKPEPTGSDDE